jgi:hypothetical protein
MKHYLLLPPRKREILNRFNNSYSKQVIEIPLLAKNKLIYNLLHINLAFEPVGLRPDVTLQSHIGKIRDKAYIEWVIYKESHEC